MQYKEFVNNRIINNILTKSIDEELGLRSRKNYKPDKIGNQHMYYHVLSDKEKDKLKKTGKDVINMKSLDLNKRFIRQITSCVLQKKSYFCITVNDSNYK